MRSFVHDAWAALNHREAMGDGTNRPPNVPNWVPDDEARRLAAYRILAAYLDNCTRYYLPEILWQRPVETRQSGPISAEIEVGKSPAEKFREYGDPQLLVEQAVALVLGDSQEIVIPDAAPVPEDATDAEKQAQAAAQIFADWLDAFRDSEGLETRLIEQEEDSVGLGDGVLVLGFDADTQRVRLRKYDIESYFPVLSGDQDVDEFPNRVHFAWCERNTAGDEVLHRLTYDRRRLPAGQTANYAYAEKPSPWAVYRTHATWQLRNVDKGAGLFDLAESTATYLTDPDGTEVRDLPVGVDFMPVVHIPNTPAGARHFGKSLLISVAQLLDDIGFADSDLAAASEVVGNTPVVTTGGVGGAALDRRPGAQWNMPAGGDAKLLDTSNVLTGQIGYKNDLLSRLSVNTRLAEALLGRVKPNEVPSGYALGLGFAPTRSLIGKMRLVRSRKHSLLLKFALRLGQVNGLLPAGPTPRAELHLGAYLPADVQTVIDQVKALLPARAISTETAVQMLVNVGVPIEDAETEVERIRAESFAEAVQLLEATGDEAVVRKFLQLADAAPVAPAPPAAGA